MARTPTSTALASVTPSQEQAYMVPRLALPNLTSRTRKQRRPNHEFNVTQRPWLIQPIAIAPVLPGETLQSWSLQSRIVTDPILNPLTGWNAEFWAFYVKHRDIDAYNANTGFVDMHLTNAAYPSLSTTYQLSEMRKDDWSAPNMVRQAINPIIKWWFRDSDEPVTGWASAGANPGFNTEGTGATNWQNYVARVKDPKWWESLKIEDVSVTMDSNLPGVVTQLPPHMSAFQTHYDQWAFMRDAKLTEATFEDYLEKFGVSVPGGAKEDEFKPELLRYIKQWQYPSNTVNPSTGAPVSAVSWAVAERGDKKRFFKEPGFIVVLSVIRPKVFFGNQKFAGSHMLTDAFGWLPAVMRDDPFTSLIEYDHDEGPFADIMNSVDDYWVDRRDLYLYGDEFTTGAAGAAYNRNIVALPTSSGDNILNRHYPALADMKGLFVDATNDVLTRVRQDGVCTFNISSNFSEDHT